MIVVCFNVGSSSLKYAAYEMTEEEHCIVDGEAPSFDDVERAVREHSIEPDAVAHRIVFGGPDRGAPARATPEVIAELRELSRYDPLHMNVELDTLERATRAFSSAVQTVSFDTAFFRRMPAVSRMLPIPHDTPAFVQRYGYHGISYEYAVSALGERARGNVIVAHLGSGASLAALRDGAPIDTTMGFSPLGGIVMGTRPGDLDPGVLLELLRRNGDDAQRLRKVLERDCGLRGISGGTADMRELLAAASRDRAAAAAVGMFVHSARKGMAAMCASLGGLDRLVFTGGIGENSADIREMIVLGLEFLEPFAVEVVKSNENLVLARHAAAIAGHSTR